MAVTTIHTIKSTMKFSIDYILNEEKTDEKILMSSFDCVPETAALEFEITRNKAQSGKVLGHHLIQSFAPGEIEDPAKAHEIGKQLADELLQGKY